jgi:hypothetical protein
MSALWRDRDAHLPFESTFSDDGSCLTQVGSGLVLGTEMVSATRALLVDVRTPTLTRCLIDLSDVTDLRLSKEEMDVLAGEGWRLAVIVPHVTVALLATRDLAFGLARMWEGLVGTTGWKTRVFRDRTEACVWLSEESGDHPR